MIDRLKLVYRTFRYQYRNDIGGMKFIKSVVKPGDTVFDIGAHKGAYLNLLRKCVGKRGTAIGFEPQVILYDYLCSIKKSQNWTNVKIEHLAFSDMEGKSNLYIPDNKIKQDSSPGASLISSKAKQGQNRIEEVSTQTLDNFISMHKLNPVFLKIDVEGNELKVLNGGINYLSTAKPRILVEIEARHVGEDQVLKTFEFMKDLNYSGKFIHNRDFISLDKFNFSQYQNQNDMQNYCNNFIFE